MIIRDRYSTVLTSESVLSISEIINNCCMIYISLIQLQVQVLVATDVMSRGLDVDGIDLVIN